MTDAVEHRAALNDAAFRAILEVLHARTGTDFSRYRLPTIARRVMNRMICIGADTFEHYLSLLHASEIEAFHLLERVTIKVSRFYRNKATFDALRTDVLPELQARRGGEPLRIWSAGCGCGEEAYTLAMVLEDAGIAGSIEATDIDPHALRTAEAGRYGAAAIVELPAELRERYLDASAGAYLVTAAARARVRFSYHDLTSCADMTDGGAGFDLVCCRNVLIYFERAHQQHTFQRIRAAVRAGGFLCLGEAEWPASAIASTLVALPHKTRVFRAIA